MDKIKIFLRDILTNPDGLSYSSKRVGGFISLLSLITYIFISKSPNVDAMFTLAGLVTVFFGLSSIDYKNVLNNPDAASTISSTIPNKDNN